MENLALQPLSFIALNFHKVIPVLEKYDLDFCCKGKRSLAEACKEKNISTEQVEKEMKELIKNSETSVSFDQMNPDQLISHILIHHHFYVNNTMPVINNYLEKLVEKHGHRFEYIIPVYNLFKKVQEELGPHLIKEEQILFPRIRTLLSIASQQNDLEYNPAYVTSPISVMESEHEMAGQLMSEIRELTNHYEIPEEACTTHRVCLEALKEFESDLHRHVHLENNILFPKVKAMAEKMVPPNHCSI